MPHFGISCDYICRIKCFDMVEIHTLSAADFKHTMKNNDLYDLVCDAIALFYRANPNPIPYERRRDGRR